MSAGEIDCDLLVLGSGAAGLSAAVTAAAQGLRVVLAEKASVLGGTTAWSGGWIWAPGSPLAEAAGIHEVPGAPEAYLRAVLGDHYKPARVAAFLAMAPKMVDFFHNNTALRFDLGAHIPDTYSTAPGAGLGGRSVIAQPYDGAALGADLALLRKPLRETTFLGLTIQAGADLRAFMTMTRSLRAFAHVSRRVLRHFWDLARHGRALQLRNGSALVARLIRSARDLGVEFRLNAPAHRLLQDNGRVTGAVLATPEGEIRVTARAGVVLATGGFAHDAARWADLGAPGGAETTLAVPEAAGEGVRLGETAGGQVARDLASVGALCPVSEVAHPDGSRARFPHIIERGKPGIIAVLANGQRFCNEGLGYHDYARALQAAVAPGEVPESWLICAEGFQRRYGLGLSRPFPLPLFPYLRRGYLQQGRSLAALARACGIDPAGLEASVARFDAVAERGEDPEFGRGSTACVWLQGDPAHQPNPCVAPITGKRYLAVKVVPGSFGTFAGLETDAKARVLNASGQPIPGLYAAGGDMASVMGGHYPAGGINLGPALTFGHIAALDAAHRLTEAPQGTTPQVPETVLTGDPR
jgi:succinate dehydrogenase/fumarate reductase flavoprotein subunit